MKRTTYEAFALASAVAQVLFEELGRLGALSLQDLGRLNERLRAHNLLQDKGSVDALLCSLCSHSARCAVYAVYELYSCTDMCVLFYISILWSVLYICMYMT